MLKKIVWTVILTSIILVMLPWETISSQYNKYRAPKEPGEYSQCANTACRQWNSHNNMFLLNEGWFCKDNCVVREWWQITENGKEECLGLWKPE
jgi:hypothetical protein